MKVVAIIQARIGSSRLPGKVMLRLGNKTVLERVVERVGGAIGIDSIVVATTTSAQDDAIVRLCSVRGLSCYRGEETDVLERYFQAARIGQADVVVRITSDCPLLDPQVLTAMVREFRDLHAAGQRVDYLRNNGFPRGLDLEVFTFQALARARAEADKAYEREHVTPYFYQHPELFVLAEHRSSHDRSDLRWTLDTPEDWEFIRKVYDAFSDRDGVFSTGEVLALMELQPSLRLLNAHVRQKALGE